METNDISHGHNDPNPDPQTLPKNLTKNLHFKIRPQTKDISWHHDPEPDLHVQTVFSNAMEAKDFSSGHHDPNPDLKFGPQVASKISSALTTAGRFNNLHLHPVP